MQHDAAIYNAQNDDYGLEIIQKQEEDKKQEEEPPAAEERAANWGF